MRRNKHVASDLSGSGDLQGLLGPVIEVKNAILVQEPIVTKFAKTYIPVHSMQFKSIVWEIDIDLCNRQQYDNLLKSSKECGDKIAWIA